MILIADSGSSKTDWILIDLETNDRISYHGIGLNPYYSDSNTISQEVKQLFNSIDSNLVSHVFFYGSGCSTSSNKSIIKKGIEAVFKNSVIEINHDLEGAARSLCGINEGIACILGTGSNAAYYNGKYTANEAVSLGYILGDEGSGYYLGKKIIHAIFLKTAPEDLIKDFTEKYELSKEKLLFELYKKPNPNRYLASFAKYIGEKRNHSFIQELIRFTFTEFLDLVVLPLNPEKKHKVNFTGSIAWFFKSELSEVVKKSGYTIGHINQKPIEDLANFHINLIKQQ